MRTISLFMNVSLDGYFETPDHDISWAHSDTDAFTSETSSRVDLLLFGHKTYDMFKSYWPTPQAVEQQPEIAKFINEKHKIVVSHHSFDPGWRNGTVLCNDISGSIKRLKAQPGKNIMIFGSNTLVVYLMQNGLIDEFQLRVNPVALGKGTSLFTGLPGKAELELADTQKFRSGTILLTYKPIANGK